MKEDAHRSGPPRAKVDALWDKLWSGGLPNPAEVIEQFSFLLFLKRFDEKDQDTSARLRGKKFKPWSYATSNCGLANGNRCARPSTSFNRCYIVPLL